VRQRKSAHLQRRLETWHGHPQTDAVAARDVTFDQASRVDLDSAKPFHPEVLETVLKMHVNGVRPWKSDQRFLDSVALPQLTDASELRLFVDEQNQRQLEQRSRLNSAARPCGGVTV